MKYKNEEQEGDRETKEKNTAGKKENLKHELVFPFIF